uniref:Uncharacterized protein n=1 Tax=Arundo donax TaxID=35708 RepID=A0A0A8YIF3_ARUDO
MSAMLANKLRRVNYLLFRQLVYPPNHLPLYTPMYGVLQ